MPAWDLLHQSVLRSALTIMGAAALTLAFAGNACAHKDMKVLHAFCKSPNCADGAFPESNLLLDKSGNLYGTASGGGKYGYGAVFKYVPGSGYFVIHNFCAQAGCATGANPYGDLVIDINGDLWGTTAGGGEYGHGEIFQLQHKANGWVLNVIYSFCPRGACGDGDAPLTGLGYFGQSAGLPWDKSSTMFGTTSKGGAYGNGIVYSFGCNFCRYAVVHSFRTAALPNALLVASSEEVFGTTFNGGMYGGGILYRLEYSNQAWTQAIFHNFCKDANCGDGQRPNGRMIADASGDLYGTTSEGGANCIDKSGCGTAFERTSGGTYQVLYSFCSLAKCVDGRAPQAGLLMDTRGNLLGTTSRGGAKAAGTVFKLARKKNWKESVQHNFCSWTDCNDGAMPVAALIADPTGNFYGTTSFAGANGAGTLFGLSKN